MHVHDTYIITTKKQIGGGGISSSYELLSLNSFIKCPTKHNKDSNNEVRGQNIKKSTEIVNSCVCMKFT